MPAIRNRWAEIEHGQKKFLAETSAESLQKVVAYLNLRGQRWEYPLWQMLQHLVNHSSYHRGQVTTMLRQLGAQPVETDFLVYFDTVLK